jgi:RNA polymerase sigma factor (sigma-70 family)
MASESGGGGDDESCGTPAGAGPADAHEGARRGAAPTSWDDAELAERVRRDETEAFAELYRRFEPMLRALAVQARVPDDDAGATAMDALSHVAMRLRAGTGPAPSRLAAYLARVLYRLIKTGVRGELRHRRLELSVAEEAATGSAERVIREASSEYAMRACLGPGAEPTAGLTPALQRLAAALDLALDDAERRALRMLGDGVPQREIAASLGITHGAARTRITRLRQRLVRAAIAYASTAPPADAAEVRRLLRRAGVLDLGARQLPQLPPDARPPSASPLSSATTTSATPPPAPRRANTKETPR